jgi:RNA polymerase sigma-70 factor (ECF subfamily)
MTLSFENLSDAYLVERLRQDDLEALGGLFDRYYTQVYRVAVAITQDSQVAEDIAQETFLRIHRYAARIDTTLPLMPWLYRVTVNLSYTWVTRQKKRRVSLEDIVDRLMSPAWLAPEHLVEHTEMQRRVRDAIRDLPFNQRVVVVLHYLNGQNLDEIAHILECPVGTVKSRLHYARETLRQRLDKTTWTGELAHEMAR